MFCSETVIFHLSFIIRDGDTNGSVGHPYFQNPQEVCGRVFNSLHPGSYDKTSVGTHQTTNKVAFSLIRNV